MMSKTSDAKTFIEDGFVPDLAEWRRKAFDLVEQNPEKFPIWAIVALLPEAHSFSETRSWVKIIQSMCIEEPDALPTDISPRPEYEGAPLRSTVAGCSFPEVQVQVLASSGLDACISRDHLKQFLEQNFRYKPNSKNPLFANSPLNKWLERTGDAGAETKELEDGSRKPGETELSKKMKKLADEAVEIADREWANGNRTDHALMATWLIDEYKRDGIHPYSELEKRKPSLREKLKILAQNKYPSRIRGVSK